MNPLHYPDQPRCEKLRDLGMKSKSGFYYVEGGFTDHATALRYNAFDSLEVVSCPSDMEMFDVLSDFHITITKKGNHAMVTVEILGMKPVHFVDTLPNAVADLILWLVENGYLKF